MRKYNRICAVMSYETITIIFLIYGFIFFIIMLDMNACD